MQEKLSRREFAHRTAGILGSAGLARCATSDPQRAGEKALERPNILWLIAEDSCPDLGCYGNSLVHTPNLDRLAAQGTLYTNAFSTAPVCSASRSAFNTGMYQTRIGAHHHRSHRRDGYQLPEGVRLLSHRFREAGYFTSNASCRGPKKLVKGKTDFNFRAEDQFDGIDWRERAPGQPFFAQVNFFESHRGFAWQEAREQEKRIDPGKVELPPYYPDDPVVREDVATYLDVMGRLDVKVGAVLKRLEEDGLAANTIVFFFGDHGSCLLRGKQWCYDAGIHVPLIARGPSFEAGSVCDGLVNLIDVSATALQLAGVPVPEAMDGVPFAGPKAVQRPCIFAARDRCDETMDRVRCVRTKRFKYIRNYMPERPYTQTSRYIETNYPTLTVLKERHAQGKLSPAQALFMADRKPDEELYDILADPYEVKNLAGDPEHQAVLDELRQTLDKWIADTGDMGALPEASSAASKE